ncbi:MAG: ParB N-terminal domain-containing protein [Chloroflexota bacterium]
MARKKTSMRGNSLFQNIQEISASKESSAAGAAVSTFPLIEIMPDPDQPRVLLSDALRNALLSGKLKPQEIIPVWENEAKKGETGKEEGSFQKIVELAASIREYGLINPITVRDVPADLNLPIHVKHLVVTGERRWWAHVYLSSRREQVQEDGDPNFIRVSKSKSGSPIRILQWIENIQREDINVVEKARGLELIRDELKQITGKETISWPEVQKVAQIGKSQRIRIMKALELDPTVIDLIVQHGLTERAIRPITEKLRGKPDFQTEAIQHLLVLRSADEDSYQSLPTLGMFIATLLGESGSGLPSDSPKTPPKNRQPRNSGLSQWHKKIANANNYLSEIAEIDLKELPPDQKQSLENDLKGMQSRISELVNRLKGK